MAAECGVSDRTLRRHLKAQFGKRAKRWVDETRAMLAREKLDAGEMLKNAARAVHIGHSANLLKLLKRIPPERRSSRQ